MSKRGKGKTRGKGGTKSTNKNSYEVNDKDIEIFNTFKQINEFANSAETAMNLDDEDYYMYNIISVEWLNHLEAHINGQEPFPSQRVNEELLDPEIHNPNNKVFKWTSKRKHYNHVLKKKVKYKKDFIIAAPAAWEFIEENYDCVKIFAKFYIEKAQFHMLYIDFETTKVIFVDSCKNLEELEEQLEVHTIQYNSDDKFDYLVDYIEYVHFDIDEEDTAILFDYYKVDNRLDSQEAIDQLIYQIRTTLKDEAVPKFTIRGTEVDLEEMRACRVLYSDVFWPRSTCIIVKKDSQQPFKIKTEMPDLIPNAKEYCEFCDEKKFLTIACNCKQVFYCSIRCRIKNMVFHKRWCSEAYDIAPLLDMTLDTYNLGNNFVYERGFTNMGNSCYLASLFQVLRQIKPFSEQLRNISREQMLELNRKELNVYPYLQDAMMRMNYGTETPYAPYLLKAAIGLKDPTVGWNSPVH